MPALESVKRHLRRGRVYRRVELAQWSKSVDRDLHALVQEGTLVKLRPGMYYRPQESAFGPVPASERELVRSFLGDDKFLFTTPNAYNHLGLGTTQLYNKTLVYNHKRHGAFNLGGRVFEFRVKTAFPKALSPEFLLVDLVNNLDTLAEDREAVLAHVRKKVRSMDPQRLKRAVNRYSGVRARKFFAQVLANAG